MQQQRLICSRDTYTPRTWNSSHSTPASSTSSMAGGSGTPALRVAAPPVSSTLHRAKLNRSPPSSCPPWIAIWYRWLRRGCNVKECAVH